MFSILPVSRYFSALYQAHIYAGVTCIICWSFLMIIRNCCGALKDYVDIEGEPVNVPAESKDD